MSLACLMFSIRTYNDAALNKILHTKINPSHVNKANDPPMIIAASIGNINALKQLVSFVMDEFILPGR